MWLVTGLGNPGPRYAGNRHNVGFELVDRLARSWAAPAMRDKFSGEYTKASFAGQDVVLLKPMTYMNLSGECLQKAMTFFKVPLARVLVVHDELDLEFEDVRVKVGGGAAGHNGLKSIIQHCGGPDFVRLRIGVGRPPRGSTESWVLGDFDSVESARLGDVLDEAARAAELVVREGPATAQNRVNRRG